MAYQQLHPDGLHNQENPQCCRSCFRVIVAVERVRVNTFVFKHPGELKTRILYSQRGQLALLLSVVEWPSIIEAPVNHPPLSS